MRKGATHVKLESYAEASDDLWSSARHWEKCARDEEFCLRTGLWSGMWTETVKRTVTCNQTSWKSELKSSLNAELQSDLISELTSSVTSLSPITTSFFFPKNSCGSLYRHVRLTVSWIASRSVTAVVIVIESVRNPVQKTFPFRADVLCILSSRRRRATFSWLLPFKGARKHWVSRTLMSRSGKRKKKNTSTESTLYMKINLK